MPFGTNGVKRTRKVKSKGKSRNEKRSYKKRQRKIKGNEGLAEMFFG
jgi:hypothetical protein